MWLFAVILVFAYFVIGLIDHILNIIKYVKDREEELNKKHPYRKKLQE